MFAILDSLLSKTYNDNTNLPAWCYLLGGVIWTLLGDAVEDHLVKFMKQKIIILHCNANRKDSFYITNQYKRKFWVTERL